MNKKPIVILFSMMLYASVFSFPVNLDLTDNSATSSTNFKKLVNEDNLIQTGENEYLAPPSSNGNGVRPPPRIPMPKPMGAHEGNGGKGTIPVKVGISESNIGIGVTNNVGHNIKNLIDDDEFDDDEFDNGEIMDLVPPSSSGNGVRPPPRIPMPKPMGSHEGNGGKGTVPVKVGIPESNVGIGVANHVGRYMNNLIDDDEFEGIDDEDISEEEDLALT